MKTTTQILIRVSFFGLLVSCDNRKDVLRTLDDGDKTSSKSSKDLSDSNAEDNLNEERAIDAGNVQRDGILAEYRNTGNRAYQKLFSLGERTDRTGEELADLGRQMKLVINFSDISTPEENIYLINRHFTGTLYEDLVNDLFSTISHRDPPKGLEIVDKVRPGRARTEAYTDVVKRLPTSAESAEILGALLSDQELLEEEKHAVARGIRLRHETYMSPDEAEHFGEFAERLRELTPDQVIDLGDEY